MVENKDCGSIQLRFQILEQQLLLLQTFLFHIFLSLQANQQDLTHLSAATIIILHLQAHGFHPNPLSG